MGVRGGATKDEGTSHRADHPRWWVILAVCLALMALVASVSSAASSGHPLRSAPAGEASRAANGNSRSGIRAPAGATVRTGQGPATSHGKVAVHRNDTVPSLSSGFSTGGARGPSRSQSPNSSDASADPSSGQTTTVPSGSTGKEAAGTVVSPAAVPSTSVSSTGDPSSAPIDGTGTTANNSTTATTSGSAGNNVATTSKASAPSASTGGTTTLHEPGNLEYPGNVSASYTVSTVGGVKASAQWSGAASLTLDIACGSYRADESGASGLSVTLPARTVQAGGGSCTVTFAEGTGSEATVSYTLGITYRKAS